MRTNSMESFIKKKKYKDWLIFWGLFEESSILIKFMYLLQK